MMKQLMTLAMALTVLTVFTACSKDDNNEEPPQQPSRTVIVYMSAENNLSTYAQMDINEMVMGVKSIPKNDNLIVFVDLANKNPFIIRLRDDKEQPADTIRQFNEDMLASDPEKMNEVLNWVVNNYPAKEYGLVLWGHANGSIELKDSVAIPDISPLRHAYGMDTGNNSTGESGKWMNIPSLRMVLKHVPVKWSFIFADCCNMANVEVAYELRTFADYLISSPAEVPGKGAPYDTMVPTWFSASSDFYKKIADSYAAAYPDRIPLSVIKMSEMGNLADATREILPELYSTGTQDIELSNFIHYYGIVGYGINLLHDINDVMLQRAPVGYAKWKKALDKAVIYKVMATTWQANTIRFDFTVTEERFSGVSIYIPQTRISSIGLEWNKEFNKLSWYHAVGWEAVGW